MGFPGAVRFGEVWKSSELSLEVGGFWKEMGKPYDYIYIYRTLSLSLYIYTHIFYILLLLHDTIIQIYIYIYRIYYSKYSYQQPLTGLLKLEI